MASPESAAGSAAEPAAENPVIFRASKKKKAYRQRPQEPDETTAADTNPVAASAPAPPEAPSAPRPADDDDEETGISVAEAIRRRNAKKHKLGGITFHARTLAPAHDSVDENTERGMVLHDAENALKSQRDADMPFGISTRFAPQTGLVGELVNKNM